MSQPELVTITIDGKEYQVPKGIPLTRAAKSVGIEIPTFCAHPKLDPIGACRMCLVEIEGPRGKLLTTACTTPTTEGLVVHYDSPRAREAREATLEFILINHPLDCPICDKGGECPLQDQTLEHGPGMSHFVEEKIHKDKHHPVSDLIMLDQERCVVCWRCIRYLEEWEFKPQLGLYNRGGQTVIDIHPGRPLTAKTSGNIIDICPVGALTNRVSRFHYRPWRLTPTATVCTHCSQGCNIRVDVRTNEVRRIVARENAAVNDQWICDKGRFAQGHFHHPDRLTQPLVRENGQLREATWEEAIQRVVDALSAHAQADPGAIGAIGSAKVSNEANYLLQKLFRTMVRTNNIDHRWGGDVLADPRGLSAIADVHRVDLFLLVGVNLAEEQPVLATFFKRAVRRSGARAIIIHPRQTEDAMFGLHLPARPGSEASVLYGLMSRLVGQERFRKQAQRLPGSREFIEAVTADYTPDVVAGIAGVEASAIEQAAEYIAASQRPLVLYGPDVVRGRWAEANAAALASLEGVLGVGTVAYLGPDANSQGARDMGVLPDHLPGHASLTDEAARQRLQRVWGDAGPEEPGLTYSQMLQAAADGRLKALFVMGADPASEGPVAAEALERLEFLVVQDLFMTETARRAHVVLPAASHVEAEGTFTNLERRVQRAPQAVRPLGQARADWQILVEIARRWPKMTAEEAEEQRKKRRRSARRALLEWEYSSARDVLQEIARAVPQYEGMTWEALGNLGRQWLADQVERRPRLHVVAPPLAAGDYRLAMERYLYDHGRILRATDRFQGLLIQPAAYMHPADVQQLGLRDGQEVEISNERERVRLALRADDAIARGVVMVPYSLPGAPAETLSMNGGPGIPVRVAGAPKNR